MSFKQLLSQLKDQNSWFYKILITLILKIYQGAPSFFLKSSNKCYQSDYLYQKITIQVMHVLKSNNNLVLTAISFAKDDHH